MKGNQTSRLIGKSVQLAKAGKLYQVTIVDASYDAAYDQTHIRTSIICSGTINQEEADIATEKAIDALLAAGTIATDNVKRIPFGLN